MKKEKATIAKEDLLVSLTMHNFPVSLLTEFAEKIVRSYYRGSFNAAIQDLIHKALVEQDFVQSRIAYIKTSEP
jgi:hypothetical protein